MSTVSMETAEKLVAVVAEMANTIERLSQQVVDLQADRADFEKRVNRIENQLLFHYKRR